MQEMLKKSDLESHGYNKEVTIKLVKGTYSNKATLQKSYFYFKVVKCSRIQEIEQELDSLMSGEEIGTRLKKEIKTRHLDSIMAQCKVGLEINFKNTSSRDGKKKVSLRRKKRDNTRDSNSSEDSNTTRDSNSSKGSNGGNGGNSNSGGGGGGWRR